MSLVYHDQKHCHHPEDKDESQPDTVKRFKAWFNSGVKLNSKEGQEDEKMDDKQPE